MPLLTPLSQGALAESAATSVQAIQLSPSQAFRPGALGKRAVLPTELHAALYVMRITKVAAGE
jgi:hypothetical protein